MKKYDSKNLAVTGANFFNYYSFYTGSSKFIIKNGASSVNLQIDGTDANNNPVITLAANESLTVEGPYDSLHFKVVTSTETSNVQILQFRRY